MNVWILRLLRTETQSWWAHRELRDRGEVMKARARERASVRSDLDVIRKTLATAGAYVSTGIGGTTIHYARGCTLSSYGQLRHMAAAQVLVRIGMPLIDTNPVERKSGLISLPIVAVGVDPDPEPWSSLSRVPLTVYGTRAGEMGAQLTNWPPARSGTA